MKAEMFLTLLSLFSTVTGLFVEATKKLLGDKYSIPYNMLAVIIALIVGTIGTFVYYALMHIDITTEGVLFSILLGISSSLTSMVGYDKVKQLIQQMEV